MSEVFDSSTETHFENLLSFANRLIVAGDPLSLRLATMCIVDYYQAILREAGRLVDLDLSSERDISGMLNRLGTRVLGVDRLSFNDLTRVRNSTYHNEFRFQPATELSVYLSKGPSRRKFLQDAATAAVRNRRIMAVAVQRLLAIANEMNVELKTYGEAGRAKWLAKIARARELAGSSPLSLSEEGLELLLDLRDQVTWSRTVDSINAAEQGDFAEQESDVEAELADIGSEHGDVEPEPEPEEFDPSDYYPDYSDQETPDEEPQEQEPPDEEPQEREPPDEEPREQEPPDEEPQEREPPDEEPPE